MARHQVRANGARVEWLRMHRGYDDQASLAKAAGFDQTTISRMERGHRVARSTAERVARVLGVELREIILEPGMPSEVEATKILRAMEEGAAGSPFTPGLMRLLARALLSEADRAEEQERLAAARPDLLKPDDGRVDALTAGGSYR